MAPLPQGAPAQFSISEALNFDWEITKEKLGSIVYLRLREQKDPKAAPAFNYR